MEEMIKVRDLTKRYGDFVALDSVTIDVFKGEVFGYLGPNGAGKTTTMMLMLGLLSPTSGEVRIMGKDIDSVRRNIGVVLDTPGLYEEFTLRENLEFFGEIYGVDNPEEKISELAVLLDLKERVDSKVKEFSKGMKQKSAIARALLHDPGLLLFDEPTSGWILTCSG
jgi:ABC-type multidrug transport system, ATPase component